jgi:putative transposase
MRSTYKVRDLEQSYFVTSTIVNWIPVFNIQQNIEILIEALIYSQKNKEFKIYDYVIMPEHFHLICQSDKLVQTIQSIKSFTAKRIIKTYKDLKRNDILEQFQINKKKYKLDSNYQIWLEGFKPKEIISQDMFIQKSNYIHFNPVKRGLVKEIEEYEYSSARDYYLKKKGRIIIDDLDYKN